MSELPTATSSGDMPDLPDAPIPGRGQWNSRLGFILAAAGSAVGLGNIWKFPYITGENGGGWFVLIYLLCIAAVGLPIMIAEVLVGRAAQASPVAACDRLVLEEVKSDASARQGALIVIGWLAVFGGICLIGGIFKGLTPAIVLGTAILLISAVMGSYARLRKFLTSTRFFAGVIGVMAFVTGFILLSFYSVVAGWSMEYIEKALAGTFSSGFDVEAAGQAFSSLAGSASLSGKWHAAFMLVTVVLVIGGIQGSIEKAAKFLMPAMLLMLVGLVVYAFTLDGFGQAASFVFEPNAEKLEAKGLLEALGHSFFTLSLGMGAMITYGSYLRRSDNIVSTSAMIAGLDTFVALAACLIMFPILFSFGMEPTAGPGLVFVSVPLAFSQMAGGTVLGVIFFVLLFFAALTSALSLLEVVVSTLIDKFGWKRSKVTLVCGGLIFAYGLLSAGYDSDVLPFWKETFGMGFLDSMDFFVSNICLPLGGLLVALFVGWVLPDSLRKSQFGNKYGQGYWWWVQLLRFVAPAGIMFVFLHSLKVI